MLSAPLESVAVVPSPLPIPAINSGGATTVTSTMCFGRRGGVVQKLQLRIRNTCASAGLIMSGATLRIRKSGPSDASST